MSYLYFDESIRENGQFIIGALVESKTDLSPCVRQKWIDMGLDPSQHEYKSSSPKEGNELGQGQRAFIGELLSHSGLALTVAPVDARRHLGNYCTELVLQLLNTGLLSGGEHVLYIDENIRVSQNDRSRLESMSVRCYPNTDSSIEAGIQLADHAAHSLGGMLLEEIGVIKKRVRAGESSGYHPDEHLS